jgi:16S rRNA (cytosine1402-N4)-methyltransferase
METEAKHKSVLVDEVLAYLKPHDGKIYLDATFGAGGHTRAILEAAPTCRVIACDWDEAALETHGVPLQQEFGSRLQLVWGNFASLYKLLKKHNIRMVDGVLADFGTSQVQIFERSGFSVYRDTPLDMRMSPAHFQMTAQDLIRTASEEMLRELFWQLGEEPHARKIAAAIVEHRAKKPIVTTGDLAGIIEDLMGVGGRRIHPATKIFQALRIYINKELENIHSLLAVSLKIVNPGGRVVCISFHSLEDRIVKQFFKDQEMLGTVKNLTPRGVVATPEEVDRNASSRSARLRAVEIVG